MAKDDCTPGVLAARYLALVDSASRRDHGLVVEKGASNLMEMLHYSGMKAAYSAHSEYYAGPLETKGKLAPPSAKTWGILTGDIADTMYRPSEVLGDDIVEPVLQAYNKYLSIVVEGETMATIRPELVGMHSTKTDMERFSAAGESGLRKAAAAARKLAEEKFKDDPQRLKYAHAYMNRMIYPHSSPGDLERMIARGNQNLTQNLLLNNIRAGMLNHMQVTIGTLPEYGFAATGKAIRQFRKAVKAKDNELLEAHVGGINFYEDGKIPRWDFFSRPESFNQGVTYYAAKNKALAEGLSESKAKLAGRKAIEQVQFKTRPGNEPRGYWNPLGATNLSLLSFPIQQRRMMTKWVGDLAEGAKTQNLDLFKESARKLIYFAGANALISGVTADIPIEMAEVWKRIAPQSWNAVRQMDRFSLMGALDADVAEISRISLLGWSQLFKVPVLWDKVGDTAQRLTRAFDHPDKPLTVVKAFKELAMFAPPIPVLGNKNAGNLLEWATRATTGDWEKYTFTGRKIQSDPVTSLRGIVTGKSLTETLNSDRPASAFGSL